jgi:outer membrane receptor for ferrienterochelin and colicins
MRKYTFIRLILIYGLFGVLVSLQYSFAQTTISGRVYDSQTFEGLYGAYVYHPEEEGNATITDQNGQFVLRLSKGKDVYISYLGYQDTVLHCDSDTCTFEVGLIAESSVLNQVVVSANKSGQLLRDLTISMESVKPYISENKNIVRLENLAEQIPGVQVVDRQANIRSGSGWSYGAGSRVMVLVDGMPMLSGDANQVLWGFLPLDGLANTEVIKGAASVLFGSSALNGVIHFRTKRPGDKPETEISTYAGLYDKPQQKGLIWSDDPLTTRGVNAWHRQKIKKHEISLSFNYNADDGYRMGDEDNRIRSGIRYRYNINPKLAVGLNTAAMTNKSSSFLLWQSLDSGYTAYNGDITSTNAIRFHADPWLRYEGKHHQHMFQMRQLSVRNDVDNGNPENDQSNESNYTYAEYLWTHEIEKLSMVINAGSSGSRVISRSPLFSGTQTALNASFFTQLDYRYKKWKVVVGGRWEYFRMNQNVESRPVFRSGVNRQLGKAGFLRASWGQGYRFPAIAERFITTSVGPLNVYANPELRSESGWNSEIGYKQAFRKGKTSLLADVSVFRMEYNDMIEFNFNQWEIPTIFPFDLGAGFKAINIGRARVDGVELSLMGDRRMSSGKISFLAGIMLSRPVSLESDKLLATNVFGDSITYVNSSNNTAENLLKYRSARQARMDVQYETTRWMLGISYRYNSAFENIDLAFVSLPLNAFISDIEEGIEMSQNGLHYVDVRLGYNFTKQVAGKFLINNLFNEIYMLRPADLRPPRSFQLVLSYRFATQNKQ